MVQSIDRLRGQRMRDLVIQFARDIGGPDGPGDAVQLAQATGADFDPGALEAKLAALRQLMERQGWPLDRAIAEAEEAAAGQLPPTYSPGALHEAIERALSDGVPLAQALSGALKQDKAASPTEEEMAALQMAREDSTEHHTAPGLWHYSRLAERGEPMQFSRGAPAAPVPRPAGHSANEERCASEIAVRIVARSGLSYEQALARVRQAR